MKRFFIFIYCISDLCVSAALDSVKEHVDLPWKSEPLAPSPLSESPNTPVAAISSDSSPSSSSSETFITPIPAINGESTLSVIVSSQRQLDENLPKDENLQSTLPESTTPDEAIDNKVSSPTAISSLQQPLNSNVPNDESSPPSLPGLQETPEHPKRVLHLRNFLQALREITPSSSESFGSLADLRKWNEEFGEGRKDRKKRQVWGRGQFGFVEHGNDTLPQGRVAYSQPKS